MKLKPITLFLVKAIIFLAIADFFKEKSLDIQVHDTYFVIEQVPLTLFSTSLFTALICFILEKCNRPIKHTIGYWHFGFSLTGNLAIIALLILSNFYYPQINTYGTAFSTFDS